MTTWRKVLAGTVLVVVTLAAGAAVWFVTDRRTAPAP